MVGTILGADVSQNNKCQFHQVPSASSGVTMDQGPCPIDTLGRITLFWKLIGFNIMVIAKQGQLVYGPGDRT